jgi:nucleoside-diphosphate-sugar epimerase
VADRKVLVLGVSGLVGYAAAKRFAAEPGWQVVGAARRRPDGLATTGNVELVSVDLTDRAACHDCFSALEDVTHVVYAALFEKPGLVPGWFEQDQMETNLLMLRNVLDPLLEAATGLEHVSLLQGTKAYGAHVEPMAVPGRERNPRHQHENFYWLQEDDLLGRQAGGSWHWTILRPVFIFGESIGSNMNPIPALGVYGALQRAAGRPLDYPGGRSTIYEAVDADLLADALLWAATDPAARDQTFNVTNGDVFTMENVWPVLAEALGMEVGERRPMSLAAEMPRRSAEWADLVERFGLRAPADVEEFVGQSFIYADLLLAHGLDQPSPPALLSTVKIRQAGFGRCMDTEDMFRKWIHHFQTTGLLPPAAW